MEENEGSGKVLFDEFCPNWITKYMKVYIICTVTPWSFVALLADFLFGSP
jgi:hypothetical protein